MKKTMILFLCLLLCGLTACAPKESVQDDAALQSSAAEELPGDAAAMPAYATLGEALTAAAGEAKSTYSDSFYCMAYYEHGIPIRIVAEMTPELSEKLNQVDFFAEDREQQITEILKDQKVISITDLSGEQIPQNELNAWAGRKGQELLDAGFLPAGHSIMENTTEFTLEKGAFSYVFSFEELLDSSDERSDEEMLADLTVKGAVVEGLSSGCTALND